MANLLKRVRNLEVRLTDISGLVPNTDQWLDYWAERLDQLLHGGNSANGGRIPIEALDAICRRAAEARRLR
jgi:hypothetical protein